MKFGQNGRKTRGFLPVFFRFITRNGKFDQFDPPQYLTLSMQKDKINLLACFVSPLTVKMTMIVTLAKGRFIQF